jgi:hypothetical protein
MGTSREESRDQCLAALRHKVAEIDFIVKDATAGTGPFALR